MDEGTGIRPVNEWIAKNIREMPGYTPEYLAATRSEHKQYMSAKFMQVE